MLFADIAHLYEKMEKTTKRLELTDMLVELLQKTPNELVDKLAYLTQGKLHPDYKGVEVGVAEKLAIRALSLSAGKSADEVREAYRKLGDLGSAAELLGGRAQATLFSEPLTLERVYETFDKMAHTTGEGSIDAKVRLLASLLNSATPREAKYIMRIATGKLRLGVADYTLLDAAAAAFTGDRSNRSILERAYNISSDLGAVIRAAAEKGLSGLEAFNLQVGKPVRPMLAERLPTPEEAIAKIGGLCYVEYKLDGERLQIHKDERQVTIFSRRLENITSHYPDVADLTVSQVKAGRAILEGEAVAIDEDTGQFLPFQELMHRRRKYGIEEAIKQFPVALNFFDVLYLNDRDLTSKPLAERRRFLENVLVSGERTKPVPSMQTADPKDMEDFMEQAIADGCEGIMIKDPNSVYRAGAREFAWIKLKREYKTELADTLDLVIIGGFHGRGRRAGHYGAYLCAVYDRDRDTFEACTKVGTGFTDEDLSSFTQLLRPLARNTKPSRVESRLQPDEWFEPKYVIEVIASEITLSPLHVAALGAIRPESGLALRFPKYTGRLRSEKSPEDGTTTTELIQMYQRQRKTEASRAAEEK